MIFRMNKANKNIQIVINSDLCTGCGTCSAFCPFQAIDFSLDTLKGIFLPKINITKCQSCGLCLKVCPGLEVDFKMLNKRIFGLDKSCLLGNYLECYSGSSQGIEEMTNSSSGGVVTKLLLFALEKGIIDGAIVTRMSKTNPLIPESILATTNDEVTSAAGSKYCPCPTNIILRNLAAKKGKFAVVGLPCHIHAIRKAMIAFPELNQKIVFTIGLFCAHATSFKGTEVILQKMGLQKGQVSKLSYRGHGWPGRLEVITLNGDACSLPLMGSFNSYYPLFDSYFFVPWRCLFCQDHFNQLSDLSVGDAWLPQFRYALNGLSLMVIRSDFARLLVYEAFSKGAITLKEISAQKVIESQSDPVRFKERDWEARIAIANKMGKLTPLCTITNKQRSSLGSYMISLFRLRSATLSESAIGLSFLNAIPLPCYRFYNQLLSMLAELL